MQTNSTLAFQKAKARVKTFFANHSASESVEEILAIKSLVQSAEWEDSEKSYALTLMDDIIPLLIEMGQAPELNPLLLNQLKTA